MPIPAPDKPPILDYQTTGIIGGLLGAVFAFWRMVKAFPQRDLEPGTRKAFLGRLRVQDERQLSFDVRLSEVESRCRRMEEGLEPLAGIDRKLDLLDDRLSALNSRFRQLRDGQTGAD